MKQVDTLTGVRGAAALWVAVHHVCGEYLAGRPDLPILQRIAAKGWLGVDLFFVLSGFVISYVYADQMQSWDKDRVGRFLKLRLARVYPAHLATTLLLVPMFLLGVALIHYRPPHDEFSLLKLVYSLTLLHGWGIPDSIGWNNVSWSVSSEWFAYLAFPLVTLAVGRVRPALTNMLLIAGVFGVTFGLALLMNGGQQYMLGQQYALLRVGSEFLIGCLAYNVFRTMGPNRSLDIGIGVSTIGIVSLSVLQIPALWDGLFIVLFVGLVLCLTRPGPLGSAMFGSRPAVYLGEISYSIYLIHPTILIIVSRLTKRITQAPSSATLLLIFILYLLATIGSAHLLFRFIEEPARARLRKRWSIKSIGSR